MNVFLFPGQGSQFPGMGKELYDSNKKARELFLKSEEILNFKITDIMFGNDIEALKQTEITQPSIYILSVIISKIAENKIKPDAVAGHSLGEFSALASAGYISFEDGLALVQKRAISMQKACEKTESTMAAIIGLDDNTVERVCNSIDKNVVTANYNCPGQIVISGSISSVKKACYLLSKNGAKKTIVLPVSGAFHSPFMKSAEKSLAKAIQSTKFRRGICPIFQNISANAHTEIEEIKINLINQLTSPVKWRQTMENLIDKKLTSIYEVGPGRVLQGLFKKINRQIETKSLNELIIS